MIGVVVVTHGDVGAAMIDALHGLVGETRGFEAVSVGPGEPRESVSARVHAARARADDGQGVILCCDLFGSTPGNCVSAEACDPHVTVLFGVSLPMLVKLASSDRTHGDPATLARQAADTALRSIRLEVREP